VAGTSIPCPHLIATEPVGLATGAFIGAAFQRRNSRHGVGARTLQDSGLSEPDPSGASTCRAGEATGDDRWGRCPPGKTRNLRRPSRCGARDTPVSNVVAFKQSDGEDASTDDLVGIPDGTYSAVYEQHRGLLIFRTPKVRVDFRLLEHPGLVLSRWYRVEDFRHGRVSACSSSDIVREISDVLGRRIRRDQIPVGALEGVIVKIQVRTVTKDRIQRPLAEVNRYSIIGRVQPSA